MGINPNPTKGKGDKTMKKINNIAGLTEKQMISVIRRGGNWDKVSREYGFARAANILMSDREREACRLRELSGRPLTQKQKERIHEERIALDMTRALGLPKPPEKPHHWDCPCWDCKVNHTYSHPPAEDCDCGCDGDIETHSKIKLLGICGI
jgi:hypothetical protein